MCECGHETDSHNPDHGCCALVYTDRDNDGIMWPGMCPCKKGKD